MTDFKFPDVGEGITEGKLIDWKIKVGDEIKTDDTLLSVQTDKAVVDIPSPISGKIDELLFNPGDTLNVGEVIMRFEKTNSVENGELTKEKQNEVSQQEQTVTKVEDTPPVPQEKKVEIKSNKETQISQSSNEIPKNNILAMPNVRIYAKENNIDLSKIKGSGIKEQVLMSDLNGISNDSKDTQKENKFEVSESNFKVAEIDEVEEETKQEETSENVEIPPSKNGPTSKPDIEKLPNNIKENVEEIDVSQKVVKNENKTTREILASPSVRQLARDLEVDINFILGSGENGKITEGDVKRAKDMREKHFGNNTSQVKVENNVEDIVTEEKIETKVEIQATQEDRIIKVEGVRKIISERMMNSLQKTAQVTISDEANVTKIVELRNKEKERLKEKGVKLTYLPFFMKAFIEVAREMPYFNSIADDENNQVILKSNFNTGIAVDSPQGLFVPVVKNVENKNIIEIAKEIAVLANLAKKGQLKLENMSDGTFSITSIGKLGGQAFTPILNYPQNVILGVGKITKKPVVELDKIVIRDLLTFSLTFDHRFIDGASAARFLKKLIEKIEDPELLFLEM